MDGLLIATEKQVDRPKLPGQPLVIRQTLPNLQWTLRVHSFRYRQPPRPPVEHGVTQR